MDVERIIDFLSPDCRAEVIRAVRQARHFAALEEQDTKEKSTPMDDHIDLLMEAWGVIANVSYGDWAQQSPEWVKAAERWRDRFHAALREQEQDD